MESEGPGGVYHSVEIYVVQTISIGIDTVAVICRVAQEDLVGT